MGCRKLSYHQELDTQVYKQTKFAHLQVLEKEVCGVKKGDSSYTYGFQGQEKDDEIKGKGNSVNYTFRMYDSRLGRMLSIDPLNFSYPFYSPYHFSSNSPIISVDLEGLQSVVILNYPEVTIEITRDENGLFFISRTDYENIPVHWKTIGAGAYNIQDISPGGIWEVNCPHCTTPTALIALPKESAVRYKTESRLKKITIKGGKQLVRKKSTWTKGWAHKESSGGTYYYVGIDMVTVSNLPFFKSTGWHDDMLWISEFSVEQAESLSSHYKSFQLQKIIIYAKEENPLDKEVIDKLSTKSGLDVEIKYTGSQVMENGNPVDYRYEFEFTYKTEVTIPDRTELVEEEVIIEETVAPVVIVE